MANIPPSISPKAFTTSALIVADILSSDLSIDEQNSLANWIQLVGQVIITNAGQKQLILDREGNDSSGNSVSK